MIKLRKIIPWLVIILLIVFGVLISHIIFFNPVHSIYSITARSEIVEFTTLDDNLNKYIVYGAAILNEEEILDSHFSGSIQINAGTQVTITRLGKGDINITLENESEKSVGKLYEGIERNLLPNNERMLDIYIDSIEYKILEGKHHHFDIEGKTNIGKNIDHLNFMENPSILQSGNLKVLGKSYIGNDYYEASTRELTTGDRVVFDLGVNHKKASDLSHLKGEGFIRIDDEPAMNLVYRRKAYKAMIFKSGPKTEESGYKISISLLERFKNDKLFKGLSVLLGFFLGLMTVMTFFYDTQSYLKGMKDGKISTLKIER